MPLCLVVMHLRLLGKQPGRPLVHPRRHVVSRGGVSMRLSGPFSALSRVRPRVRHARLVRHRVGILALTECFLIALQLTGSLVSLLSAPCGPLTAEPRLSRQAIMRLHVFLTHSTMVASPTVSRLGHFAPSSAEPRSRVGEVSGRRLGGQAGMANHGPLYPLYPLYPPGRLMPSRRDVDDLGHRTRLCRHSRSRSWSIGVGIPSASGSTVCMMPV